MRGSFWNVLAAVVIGVGAWGVDELRAQPIVQPPRVFIRPPEAFLSPSQQLLEDCRFHTFERIVALLNAGADPNAQDERKSKSALSEGVLNRDERIYARLLAAGAKPDDRAMEQAAWANKPAIIAELLKAGGRLDATLLGAVNNREPELLKSLLNQKANPNVRSPAGSPVLHLAAMHGYSAAVELLLAAGADANALCPDGQTALNLAVLGDGDLKSIQLLVKAGTRLDIPDRDGQTPVQHARIRWPGPVYQFLLAASGGKEPRPASDPTSAASKKTTPELVRDWQLEPQDPASELLHKQAYRELMARGGAVMPEIMRQIAAGESITKYYGLFQGLGPDAEAALPKLAEQLEDKEQVFYALFVMNGVKPGCIGDLPREKLQRVAGTLYRGALDPGELDLEPGHLIATMIGLGMFRAPFVLKLLQSDDADLRRVTVDCLQGVRFQNDEILEEMIELASTPGTNYEAQEHAIRAMTSFSRGKNLRVRAVLLKLMQNPPPIDRQPAFGADRDPGSFQAWKASADTAALCLTTYGPTAINDVLPLLTPEDRLTRLPAMTMLQRLDERSLPRLIELLGHQDPAIQSAVASALGTMDIYRHGKEQRPIAVPALEKALRSPNERIAVQATTALFMSLSGKSAPTLLAAAGDENCTPAVRAVAARMVLDMQGREYRRAPEILSAIPALLNDLEKGTFVSQFHAARALGTIGAPAAAALPLLQKRLALPAADVELNQLPRDSSVSCATGY